MPLLSYKNYPFYDLFSRFRGVNADELPGHFWFDDHFGGYDQNLGNAVLQSINDLAMEKSSEYNFIHHQVLDSTIRQKYPAIRFHHSSQMMYDTLLRHFKDYRIHPEIRLQNFVCSFNGSPHVSRKLLAAILQRLGWFDIDHCSKNFTHEIDVIDGHIRDLVGPANSQFYRKFFIGDDSAGFFDTINSFGHDQYDHARNIHNLDHRLARSFLHVVSETMATSYYPHVTEKFMYSVVTRGLFLAYAQPGWHDHLERYYGFKKYNKIFDYRFDLIKNPVERLVELMSMISKFSVLSSDDWRDLYEMEIDAIEHNYNHYFSKDYMKVLADVDTH